MSLFLIQYRLNKIKNVVIGKQFEKNSNLEEFINEVKNIENITVSEKVVNAPNNLDYSIENLVNSIEKMPEVKSRIIREYLDSVENSKPEITLISGDGDNFITPSSNPKTIFEAGNFAKNILDKN